MINERLLARISSVVKEVPPTLVDSLIERLNHAGDRTCDQQIKAQLFSKALTPKFRQLLLELTDSWGTEAPEVTCSSLGNMLATAKYCEQIQRNTSAELVWT